MPKKNPTTSEILTPKEQAFVANWNGNQVETCKLAGIQPKNANRFMQRPRVKRAIEQKQFVTIVEAAKAQVTNDTLNRTYILQRLKTLADLSPEDTKGSITGQVNALKLGAEIQGYIIERSADLTAEFENRSEHELEFFYKNGYWPSVVDPRQSRPN